VQYATTASLASKMPVQLEPPILPKLLPKRVVHADYTSAKGEYSTPSPTATRANLVSPVDDPNSCGGL
jgi:hypothetical protein